MQQSSYAEACTVGAGLASADAAGEFFSGAGAYGAGAAFGEGAMEGRSSVRLPVRLEFSLALQWVLWSCMHEKKRPDMEGMTAPPRCRHFKSGGEPDV